MQLLRPAPQVSKPSLKRRMAGLADLAGQKCHTSADTPQKPCTFMDSAVSVVTRCVQKGKNKSLHGVKTERRQSGPMPSNSSYYKGCDFALVYYGLDFQEAVTWMTSSAAKKFRNLCFEFQY